MPLLAKKNGYAAHDVLTKTAPGRNDGLAWEDDQYRPSGASLDGLGLPASLGTARQQRRLCGNAECASGWTRLWRNRRRPIFEGQWGCSGRCVLAMVRSAVRREQGDGGAAHATPHRHRVPLGLLMLAQGWITHSQLQKALAAQRESGTGRIGDWLMSECGLGGDQIARGLSMQWGCPVLTTAGFSPELMSLVMPKMFIEQFEVLPLRVAGSQILYLGSSSRLDASAAFAVEQMTELKVESGVVEGALYESARNGLLACEGIEVKLETVDDKDAMAARITAILEQRQPSASRLVRLHQYYWLRIWLESGTFRSPGSLPVSGEDVNDYIFAAGSLKV
jgi:Type II secretion system (T2SS), protein E, N-terminal domain